MSKQTVILLKDRNKAAGILVSRDLRSVEAGQYEFHIIPDEFVEGEYKPIGGRTPDHRFVRLQAGESYVLETTEYLVVPRSSSVGVPGGSIPPSQHYIQLEIHTWPEFESSAQKLRKRWQRFGTLYSGLITSEPTPFTVEKDPAVLEECE